MKIKRKMIYSNLEAFFGMKEIKNFFEEKKNFVMNNSFFISQAKTAHHQCYLMRLNTFKINLTRINNIHKSQKKKKMGKKLT